MDSAKQNLASTFVNAFVNIGFGKDKLLFVPEGSEWLYKNKESGMLSAAASLGMIMMWNLEEGYTALDQYTFSQQDYIKAGALLGQGDTHATSHTHTDTHTHVFVFITGLISCSVTSDMDCALALLPDHLNPSSKDIIKVCAAFG